MRRRRAGLAALVICALVFCLGAAFFRTQVLQKEGYALRSQENRLRIIPVPAPRGTVYDRNGLPIAETVTSYALYLQPTSYDSVRVALSLLQPVLQLSDSVVSDVLRTVERNPKEGPLLSPQLSFDQVSWVEEHRSQLPALLLEPRPMRRYPQGEAVAHLIGYVAEISERELADSLYAGYRMGQLVGKNGLERQYEAELGGVPGARYVEVDARGRVVGALAPEEAKAPVAGRDVRTSLDVELQRFAHEIFPKELNGAIVAMVPSTGEILALYSHPTYDPNQLVGGASTELWRELNDDPRHPLLNRATSGIYAPGSTWKLATAIVGLEQGVITPETRMPIPCSGGMTYAGRYSRCWKPEGHGDVNLAEAIANSCNVYFYQLGIWLGLNQLAREGTRLGFSRETGIDLPAEVTGTFPTGSDWYRERFGWNPTPSEVMSLSIGQGPNAQTPIRMAQFFAALAGNGTAPAPRIVRGPGERPPAETDLKLSPETLRALRVGLAGVTAEGGTAYLASLDRWKLYGKSGTSQNAADMSRPHAWFTGFAGPVGGEPEIAVAVLVEFGESGSGTAAPIAAKVADFFLSREHGVPFDRRRQTLGERMAG